MKRISDFLYIKLNNRNSNDFIETVIVFVVDGTGKNDRLILFPGAKNIIRKASKHVINATTSLLSKNFAFNLTWEFRIR